MALKKAALARAEYCCQHQSSDGIRCKQKSALQFDHIHPFTWGGGNQLDNIKVLCAAHHRLKTEIQQGPWVRGEKSCKSG
jgi:5-methylcytosine-specific restriction endonuclease McrA